MNDFLDPQKRAGRVVNALTIDVEEYYHGVEFVEALGVDAQRRLPSRVGIDDRAAARPARAP